MDDLISSVDLLKALMDDKRGFYDDLERRLDLLEALGDDRSIGRDDLARRIDLLEDWANDRSVCKDDLAKRIGLLFAREDEAKEALENDGNGGDGMPKVFYNRQLITFAEKMPWKGKVNRAFVRICIDEDGISIQTENRFRPYGEKRASDEFVSFTQRYSWGNASEIFMNPPQKFLRGFAGIRMDISGTCEVHFGDDAPVRCSKDTYVWLPNQEVLRDVSKAICAAALYWAQKKQMSADKVVAGEQKLGVVDDILEDAKRAYEDTVAAFCELRRNYNNDRWL